MNKIEVEKPINKRIAWQISTWYEKGIYVFGYLMTAYLVLCFCVGFLIGFMGN